MTDGDVLASQPMDYKRHAEQETPNQPKSSAHLTGLGARTNARPLSDIKEITEPSLIEGVSQNNASVKNAKAERQICEVADRDRTARNSWAPPLQRSMPRAASQSRPYFRRGSPASETDRSSVYTIPSGKIPPRSSSKGTPQRSASIPRQHAVRAPSSHKPFRYVRNHGQSESPVKGAIDRLQRNHREIAPRIPSKTIIKIENPSSEHIIENPTLPHPRLKVDVLAAAPLFVGGSSCEGTVRIVVDEAERIRHKKTLTLERVSVDLLGIEEVTCAVPRRHVFLALGNELVDLSHPPPTDMIESQQLELTSLERSWVLTPSVSTLPFLLRLPLNVGPPPFQSRHARIKYVLCATLTIKDAGRQLCVRCTQETSLLSVQDPEKALISLPSPLTASEEFVLSRNHDEHIIVTAGLHRQVWVSGTNLFADIHIVNNSRKMVKKLELKLERIVLCYRHAAAATLETSASSARMFDHKEHLTIAKRTVKSGGNGWNGVLPHTTLLRTCDLEIPKGHATISCHKFFEARYYLYASVYMSHTKVATIQLPIHLIHMNSLDIPTNSVAQVAAAIQERKRSRSLLQNRLRSHPRQRPSKTSLQGRAFAAPRMQSLDRAKAQRRDLRDLGQVLANTPSRRDPQSKSDLQKTNTTYKFKTPPSNRKGRIFGDEDAYQLRKRLNTMRAASFDSDSTNESVPKSRHPQRRSSVLGTYLQQLEDSRGIANMFASGHNSGASSQRSSLDCPDPQPLPRPSWL